MAFSVTNTFVSGTKAKASEVNANFQDVVDELNGTTTTNLVMAPIGAVVAWLKSLTGTPATLPAGWVECDGSTISDADSPYNGVTIPNLNSGTQRFIRGSTTSGTTGGDETHNHTGATNLTGRGDREGTSSGAGSNSGLIDSGGSTIEATVQNISTDSHLPPYYEAVWIMRIK